MLSVFNKPKSINCCLQPRILTESKPSSESICLYNPLTFFNGWPTSSRKGLVIFYIPITRIQSIDFILEIFHFKQKSSLLKSSYPKQQSSKHFMPNHASLLRYYCDVIYNTVYNTYATWKKCLEMPRKYICGMQFAYLCLCMGSKKRGWEREAVRSRSKKTAMNTSITDLRSCEGLPKFPNSELCEEPQCDS